MSDELDQLRAENASMRNLREACRLCGLAIGHVDSLISENEQRIAKLEAEAADPWWDAKSYADEYRGCFGRLGNTVAYIDHLTAENARLAKRVAELEAEDTADVADAEAALAKGEFVPFEDMQPPFEGPIVGLEPILDPARVLATAAELGWGPTVYAEMTLLRDAKPYRLKGTDE